jgi:predicted Fe-Mo cluster-binding NifX family protein
MKIAFASNDGKTIAAHFGHCACFLVLSVEDGRIAGHEVRKPADNAAAEPDKHSPTDCHCHSPAGTGHKQRLAMLADCEVLICLGIGPRAVGQLKSLGIKPVILSEPIKPEIAAIDYARGKVQTSAEWCCPDHK